MAKKAKAPMKRQDQEFSKIKMTDAQKAGLKALHKAFPDFATAEALGVDTGVLNSLGELRMVRTRTDEKTGDIVYLCVARGRLFLGYLDRQSAGASKPKKTKAKKAETKKAEVAQEDAPLQEAD